MVETNNNQEIVQEEGMKEINIDEMSDRKLGETFEKPQKVELDGQEVEITAVSLKLTNDERTTKDGSKKTRNVIFTLEYNNDQKENYGGVSSFVYSDGNVGEPTIWAEGKSAAAKLFNKWLDFHGKKKEQVSFKEFFAGLRGMKAKISTQSVHYMGEEYRKNVVSEFVKKGGNSPSSTQNPVRSKVSGSETHPSIDTAGDIPPQPTRPETDSEWFSPKETR